MKIWFMCDLHLQRDEDTIQHKAYDYVLKKIKQNGGDAVIFAGDFTSDGSRDVYNRAIEKLKSLEIPAVFIPGNSDLRCEGDKDYVYTTSSDIKTDINGLSIYAINDSDGYITDEALSQIENAQAGDIVFMHHPIFGIREPARTNFKKWRESHPDVYLFFGHIHKAYRNGNDFSLPALDPDKSIGESPSILLFDTDSSDTDKLYYPCPVPSDIYGYLGISTYRTEEHIALAAKHGLKHLELRPQAISMDRDRLKELIENWRKCGGECLSIHLPELTYADNEAVLANSHYQLIDLGEELGADRFTQHAPKVPVALARENKECLPKIAKALAGALEKLTKNVTVGIENMHMTKSELPDDTRRYGYLPSECLEFMNLLAQYTRHKVGINLDVGHARNNPPFSERYQISGWYSAVGKYCVGYHVHQVSVDESFNKHNHTAITDVYGHLISYASFFRTWSDNQLSYAPVIFEMDEENAYEITLDTFNKHKKRGAL